MRAICCLPQAVKRTSAGGASSDPFPSPSRPLSSPSAPASAACTASPSLHVPARNWLTLGELEVE